MRFLLTLAVLVIVGGLAAAGSLKLFSHYIDAPGPLAQQTIVFIAPGTGVRQMAAELKKDGVIDEPYAFLAAARLLDVGSSLKAGEYEMPAQISLRQVLGMMQKGLVLARKITIPEGLTRYEVAAIINAAPVMTGTVEAPPEGSVLPETYAYIRNDDRSKKLALMQAEMTETLDELWAKRSPDLPFTTKEEALTMASIVERETGIGSERARIAGVYTNRLRKGMMLQSDPTVIYAVTHGQSKLDRVLYEHLAVASPYNTYKNVGLPPGPICNPGRAAIEAALNPEKNDFIYFVADGTGGHVFATTAAEHEANVLKWRAVQRAARAAAAQ